MIKVYAQKLFEQPHERNLINVAVTRARKKLFIIGNENFILSKSGLLTELINFTHYCNNKNNISQK